MCAAAAWSRGGGCPVVVGLLRKVNMGCWVVPIIFIQRTQPLSLSNSNSIIIIIIIVIIITIITIIIITF
jgi:hypothetical protein